MHANYGFVTYKLILTYSKTVSEETSTTGMVKAQLGVGISRGET